LEYGVVRQALQRHEKQRQEGCINVPRYQFGVRESHKSKLLAVSPPGLNMSISNVVTERFQFREKTPMQLDDQKNTSAGKNVVNVQLIRSFPEVPSLSVHQVLPECNAAHDENDDPVVLVYHYSGSKAQFNFRHDPRGQKLRIKFEERQKETKTHDSTITGWLRKFVDFVGLEEATHLLQDVGEPTKAGKIPFYDCGCPETCDVVAMDKTSPKDLVHSCQTLVRYLVEKFKCSVEAACIIAVKDSDVACGFECHPRVCTPAPLSSESKM